MRGSLYPDGTTIDHVALRRTETTKSEEILRNRVDWTSRGMFTGGEITVNTSGPAPYLNIDVKQLSGFAPNGEFIETTSDYYNIALSDYTSGVVNRVLAIYTEDQDYYQPHESDGERYATRAQAAWRIRVYTDAQYNALPDTDDNLANDAKDRCLLIGKVTAQGASTSLTQSNIQSPTSYRSILYSSPSSLITITGVTVLEVSSDSPVGDGTLDYDFTTQHEFVWTTSNGAGPTVIPTTDGIYNFTDGAGAYIRCLVTLSLLPTTGLPLSEIISLTNLYYQAIPRLTASDLLHRNYRGTGIVSPTNPHGLSIEDISGQSLPYLEQHQDIMHCNGIWRESSSNIFMASINTGSTGGDTLNIQDPGSGDLYYINGKQFDSILNNQIYFDPSNWDTAWGNSTSTGLLEVYVDDESNVFAQRKMSYPSGSRNVQGTWIVDCSKDYPAGTYVLEYDNTGANHEFTWDGGSTLSIAPADLVSQVIRLYSKNGKDWVDLWVNGDSTPSAADDTLPSGVSTYQDNIVVSVSPDRDQNMQILSLSLWYDSVTPKRKLGYAPYAALRRTIDKRPWGTLCVENLSDSLLQEMVYSPNDEYLSSGIVFNRNGFLNEFELYNIVALAADIRGGAYYCRGKRIESSGDTGLAFADNATNLVYVDFDGNYHVLDVTTDFGGNIVKALKYVVGSSALTPNIDDETHFSIASTGEEDRNDPPERGVALWSVETSGGSVTSYADISKNVNNVEVPWSVGIRRDPPATVETFSGASFDSLYSAFLYAELTQEEPYQAGAVEVFLVGSSVVNRRITQPRFVNVRGSASNPSSLTPSSTVYITNSESEGSWVLSPYNVLENVRIRYLSGTGAALLVADGVTIRGCRYSHAAASQEFMSMNDSSWVVTKIENVTIQDCEFDLDETTVFTNWTALIDGYQNFQIVGDHFQSTHGSAALLLQYMKEPRISENRFRCSGGTTFVGAVYLEDCIYVKMFENHIELADSVGSSEAAVSLNTVTNSVFKGNTITRADGSSSIDGVAFSLTTCSSCDISENVVDGVGTGIEDSTTGGSSNTFNGNILDVFYGGIIMRSNDTTVDGNSISSESVGIISRGDRNTISNNTLRITTVRDNIFGSVGGSGLGSLGVTIAPGSSDSIVVGNTITMWGDSGVLRSSSYVIEVDDGAYRFSIESNKIYVNALSGVSGGGLFSAVYVADVGVASNVHYTIKENVIDLYSNLPSGTRANGIFINRGAYTPTPIGAAQISDNVIISCTSIGEDASVYALYVMDFVLLPGDYARWTVVQDNLVSCPDKATAPNTLPDGSTPVFRILTKLNSYALAQSGVAWNF